MAQWPMVSVGIPLYRSARFFDNICRNIDAMDYPNLEILISDRHGLDDTIERLEARYAGDTRFRFLKSSDQKGWIDNYNLLLQSAKGTYFRWIPHDDHFPVCNLKEMVSILETDPEAIAVFGPSRGRELDGQVLAGETVDYAGFTEQKTWSLDVFVFFQHWHLALGALKALFRTAPVHAAGHYFRPTWKKMYTERVWLSGLALMGRFRWLDSFVYIKNKWDGSTTSSWSVNYLNLISIYLRQIQVVWSVVGIGKWSLTATVYLLALMLRSLVLAAVPVPFRKKIRPFPGKIWKNRFVRFLSGWKIGSSRRLTGPVVHICNRLPGVLSGTVWIPEKNHPAISLVRGDQVLSVSTASSWTRFSVMDGTHPGGLAGFALTIPESGDTQPPLEIRIDNLYSLPIPQATGFFNPRPILPS